MPRYKPVNLRQDAFVPLRFDRQILPGTFEYALHHLLEETVEMAECLKVVWIDLECTLICIDRLVGVVVVVDADDRVRLINQSAAELLNAAMDDMEPALIAVGTHEAADVLRRMAYESDDAANAAARCAAALGAELVRKFFARLGGAELTNLYGPTEAAIDAGLLHLIRVEGLRIITIAPELPGALDMIRALAGRGVRVSLGHSAATVPEARAGYAAGAVTTTHLFNAMVGVVHREPGLALTALLDDGVWVELIADTLHVDPELFPLIWSLKPPERVLLVSDAIALADSGVDYRDIGFVSGAITVRCGYPGYVAGSTFARALGFADEVRRDHAIGIYRVGPMPFSALAVRIADQIQPAQTGSSQRSCTGCGGVPGLTVNTARTSR